jgi:integrase
MSLIISNEITHSQAIELVNEGGWRQLKEISVRQASDSFLSGLKKNTGDAYRCAFNLFFALGFLDPEQPLQVFALSNVDNILDDIRLKSGGAEASRQARAACFISFCSFLSRRTGGLIRKAIASKEGVNKTFKKLRSTSKTKALTKEEWRAWIGTLRDRSERDAMIAEALYGGAKRVSEVIGANIEEIDWRRGTIRYKQLKASEEDKETIIYYPQDWMSQLKDYLQGRTKGAIFITRTGKRLTRIQIYLSFANAGVSCGIGKVHPHMLRTSAITRFKEKGCSAEDIQKVSGHATVQQVIYYNKTKAEDNISKEYPLF